ncbi:Uncharacterized conserved protein, heparinase superfamily [Jannaschia faecimaris]|uniref:Uncharacterized conserved protein, heparinase superfamily n=2 Tax=Jannaschia faecimaris TaxID=1244108 RepID=A0A1H3MVG8_9RHOB|nr:Uncharacterized conserved protein, heparinase superfamily [Jannaschia faecimaris]
MLSGLWHMAGQLVEAPGKTPWQLEAPSTPFEMQLHGQGWLDDIMASGGRKARTTAQLWVLDWAKRFGGGKGPGWDAALTGRRLLRQISHAPTLLSGMEARDQATYFDLLYRQAAYLSAEWTEAPAGLARMEALTGLLYAGLTLEGMAEVTPTATLALTKAAREDILPDGGIASRNPEALLEMAMLLGWAIDALRAKDTPPDDLLAAQARMVPTLRALRHANGELARFHGGGKGRPGRLDRVLATSGIRERNNSGLAMGYAPVAHGRTTLIADAQAPATGAASGSAHASTLAFELTSGNCPVVANCGPGGAFGPDWHRASRATASHSTLEVTGWSTARVGPLLTVGKRQIAPMILPPKNVQWQRSDSRRASTLVLSHDGYRETHGLTHLRRLVLSTDGRKLEGEDSLRAMSNADKDRLDDTRHDMGPHGLPFAIRFHLHPDTDAEIDMGGRAASLALPSGEIWVFRPLGNLKLTLEPSVHLESGRLKPRPAQQVVLSDALVSYAATIDWTLTRAQEATDSSPSRAEDGL